MRRFLQFGSRRKHAMAFDTLTYAKKLQESGVPSRQAEAHAEALKDLVEGNLATKQDIESVRLEIELLRRDMKRDMKEMDSGLRHEIELLRRDILIKLGGIVVAGVTVLAAMIGVVIALIQA